MDESDGFSDTGIEEGEGDSEGVVYEDSVTEVVDLDGEGTESDSDDEMEGSIDTTDDAELGGGATLHPDSNFVMHKGSVFSVAVDPSGSLCCSGGEDDKALVWRLTDGLQLLECQGHKDSVTHVGFSHDGKMVATGDMSGEIQVREVSTGTLVWSFSTGDLEWHPLAHVLLAGTVDGAGWMWKIPSGECRTFPAHGGRNTCGTVLGDGKQAVFGYESGVVKVWDLKTGTPNSSTGAGQGAHRMSVNCVACSQDSTLLLSGSEDSTAKLCSSSSGKVLATFPAGIPVDQPAAAAATSSTQSPPEQSFSVETVVFCPTLPLALTGSLSGAMAVWDVPSQKMRTLCHHPEGVVKILCSSRSHCCYTGCLDGRVRQWDLQTGEQVKAWQGHPDGILDMALTREEDRLLSCSNDGTIQVFSTQ